jgi:hypothetical protein
VTAVTDVGWWVKHPAQLPLLPHTLLKRESGWAGSVVRGLLGPQAGVVLGELVTVGLGCRVRVGSGGRLSRDPARAPRRHRLRHNRGSVARMAVRHNRGSVARMAVRHNRRSVARMALRHSRGSVARFAVRHDRVADAAQARSAAGRMSIGSVGSGSAVAPNSFTMFAVTPSGSLNSSNTCTRM